MKAKKKTKKTKTADEVRGIRFTTSELRLLNRAADKLGQTFAMFVRRAAVNVARRPNGELFPDPAPIEPDDGGTPPVAAAVAE